MEKGSVAKCATGSGDAQWETRRFGGLTTTSEQGINSRWSPASVPPNRDCCRPRRYPAAFAMPVAVSWHRQYSDTLTPVLSYSMPLVIFTSLAFGDRIVVGAIPRWSTLRRGKQDARGPSPEVVSG